jgi:hydrogenase nickel incorporation protein HypA/HybF
MHEMAIAEAVVSGALEEWKKWPQPARLMRVGVVIGDLHQIVEDNFRAACEVLSRGTAMEHVPIEIRRVPVMVKCRTCGCVGTIEMPFFICGTCGGGDLEVVAGNELHLERLELVNDHDDAND